MKWFFWTQIQRRLKGLRLNEEKGITLILIRSENQGSSLLSVSFRMTGGEGLRVVFERSEGMTYI